MDPPASPLVSDNGPLIGGSGLAGTLGPALPNGIVWGTFTPTQASAGMHGATGAETALCRHTPMCDNSPQGSGSHSRVVALQDLSTTAVLGVGQKPSRVVSKRLLYVESVAGHWHVKQGFRLVHSVLLHTYALTMRGLVVPAAHDCTAPLTMRVPRFRNAAFAGKCETQISQPKLAY